MRQSPQWPPPSHHTCLADCLYCFAPHEQCSTMNDNLLSGCLCLPDPRTGLPTQAHLTEAQYACMCVPHVAGGPLAGMPLLALSLLYLINVIYSWSSVPVGKEPCLSLPVCTAQPPPLLTFRLPAPVRLCSPSGQLPAEGRRRYLWLFFLSGLPCNLHLLLCCR